MLLHPVRIGVTFRGRLPGHQRGHPVLSVFAAAGQPVVLVLAGYQESVVFFQPLAEVPLLPLPGYPPQKSIYLKSSNIRTELCSSPVSVKSQF